MKLYTLGRVSCSLAETTLQVYPSPLQLNLRRHIFCFGSTMLDALDLHPENYSAGSNGSVRPAHGEVTATTTPTCHLIPRPHRSPRDPQDAKPCCPALHPTATAQAHTHTNSHPPPHTPHRDRQTDRHTKPLHTHTHTHTHTLPSLTSSMGVASPVPRRTRPSPPPTSPRPPHHAHPLSPHPWAWPPRGLPRAPALPPLRSPG